MMKQATSIVGIRASPLMYMYSGHDSTISPLLAALGQPESHWPPFTANLVYELWQRGSAKGGTRQQGEGGSRQWGAGGGGDEGGEQQEMRRRQAGRLRRRLGMVPHTGGGGGGTGGGGEGGGSDSAQAFDVRVLYNQQVMDLQYSRKGRRRHAPSLQCDAANSIFDL